MNNEQYATADDPENKESSRPEHLIWFDKAFSEAVFDSRPNSAEPFSQAAMDASLAASKKFNRSDVFRRLNKLDNQ